MSQKQLITLFVCSLVTWIVFQSLLTLLPVYAVRLGADPGQIGNYLAFSFAALTAGTVSSGWLSNKFQRRKTVLIAVTALNIPFTALLSQTVEFWQLAALSALVFFLGGAALGTLNILAGLFAGEQERGKIFGILGINLSLGALIGGALSGPIVERWDFDALFIGAGVCWVIQPLVALLLEDKAPVPPERPSEQAGGARNLPAEAALGRPYYLLLFATFLAFACGFVAVLARPLQMDRMAFSPAAISGVVALGGAVSLPFPILLGWLSDRIDRYRLVALCFLINAVGLVALAASAELWHFGMATVLLSGVGVSVGIGQALVIDLVPPKALATALSRFGSAPAIGAVIGLTLTGYALQTLGSANTLIVGTVLTLLATGIIIRVRSAQAAPLKAA